MIELRLLSRPDCHLCDDMRKGVDQILDGEDREWTVVDVDGDPELARKFGEVIPVLFVNGRLFARIRLPRLAIRLRLRRAAGLPA